MSTESAQEQDLKHLNPLEGGAFWQQMGVKIVALGDGFSHLTMVITPEMLQLYSRIHGGAIATLADCSIGSAVTTTLHSDEASTTVDLNIKYARSVSEGTLYAQGKVIRRGRSVIFGESYITDDADNLVAWANATFNVLNKARWQR